MARAEAQASERGAGLARQDLKTPVPVLPQCPHSAGSLLASVNKAAPASTLVSGAWHSACLKCLQSIGQGRVAHVTKEPLLT